MAQPSRCGVKKSKNKIVAACGEGEGILLTKRDDVVFGDMPKEVATSEGNKCEEREVSFLCLDRSSPEPAVTERSRLEQLLEERLDIIEQKLDGMALRLSSDPEGSPQPVRPQRRAQKRRMSGWGTSGRFGPGPAAVADYSMHVVAEHDGAGDHARGGAPDSPVLNRQTPQVAGSDPWKIPSPRPAQLLAPPQAQPARPSRSWEPTVVQEEPDCLVRDESKTSASPARSPPASPRSLPHAPRGGGGRHLSDRLWVFFEEPGSSVAAKIYHQALIALILLSVLVPIIETLPVKILPAVAFFLVSTAIDTIFLSELCIRWLVSPSPLIFPLRTNNVLDIAIVGPFALRIAAFCLWSESGTAPNPEASRIAESIMLCVVPVLRLVKALRNQRNFTLLVYTLQAVCEPLFVPFNMLAILCLFFSCVLYVVEPRDNVLSMPHAMWLVIVTVSTVGYGDVSAVSDLGRMVTCVLIFVGCLCMAMPIGIVGAAFTETWRNRGRILVMRLIRDRLRQWGHTDESLRSLFSSYGGGDDLSYDGFSTLIGSMKLGLSEGHIKGVFSIIDADSGGSIDFKEFVDAVDLGHRNPFHVF